MPKPPTKLSEPQSLVQVVSALRGPEGCPWDLEQTHESLSRYAIEEAHELAEALESKNDSMIKDELGDVLFQVILHCQLAQERGAFSFDDVVKNINEKLIRRHPHVFADQKVSGTAEVIANWEQIKRQEKLAGASEGSQKDGSASKDAEAFDLKVPAGLPALQRAAKIGFRTEKLKFDWENSEQVLEKVREEMAELEEALDSESDVEIRHELGDVIFSLAQLARHLDMDPEQIGREANRRFEHRFKVMMDLRSEKSLNWDAMSLDQKQALWVEAKLLVRAQGKKS